MHIHVSPKNGVPIYLQIVNQIKYLAASGQLRLGEEILPIRVLAEQLLINPNTVARAYRELEMAGVLTKRLGAGTYISCEGSPLSEAEKVKILRERAAGLVVEARQLSVPISEVVALIEECDRALTVRDEEGEAHE